MSQSNSDRKDKTDSKAPITDETSVGDEATPQYSISDGDPDETIGVPMVLIVDKANYFQNMIGKRKLEHQVHIRYMKRSQYQKHYAKDKDGNYVGTGAPAPDAHMVYIANKSTPEDLKKQIEKAAHGKDHLVLGLGFGENVPVSAGLQALGNLIS